MKSNIRTLLLLALLAMLLLSHVRAQEENDEAAEDDEIADDVTDAYESAADATELRAPFITRAIFPNNTISVSGPKLPAGTPAKTVIAYQNNDIGTSHQVVLVAAYLQPLNNYATVLQNFSVVRQGRTVEPSETVTLHYSFTPDATFEPGEYSLVVGVYYADVATNVTQFAVAYNSTVYIDDTLGTDPRTILTYLTLLVIFGAVAYYLADRFGIVKMIETNRHSSQKSSHKPHLVEMGTGKEGYDPDYVSQEHVRYRESLLRKSSSSPSQRHTSASPKKKN